MNNPLVKKFRQPAIYIKLPSEGRWWDSDAINIPANGELGIMPMAMADEIALKTPDGLLNGSSIVKLIESCVPSIKDAWKTPSLDMDALLIGIRIASNGNNMEIEAKCPKCEHENSYDIDLSQVLSSIQKIDYNAPLVLDGMKIFFQPVSYKVLNDTRQIEFEVMQKARALDNSSITDEAKLLELQNILQTMINDSTEKILEKMSYNISHIEMEDGVIVSSPEYIIEYLKNADRTSFNAITTHLSVLKEQLKYNIVEVTCEECDHAWKVDLGVDYANFLD